MSDDPFTGSHDDPTEPRSERVNGSRLPPPAFPPGSRRVSVHRGVERDRADQGTDFSDGGSSDHGGVPDDAFILPDEPFERALSDDVTFISPDEPIPHREPRLVSVSEAEDDEEDDEAFDPDDVVVTGIGDDAHLDPTELAFGGDPPVLELVEQVGKLAEDLRHRGEAGLRTTPEMSRFEATLRAYCVGYLAGRRTEDERDG